MGGLAPLGPSQRERSLREGEISKPRCINGEQGGWFHSAQEKKPRQSAAGPSGDMHRGLADEAANPQLKHRTQLLVSMSETRRRVAQKAPRGEAGLPVVPACALALSGHAPGTHCDRQAHGLNEVLADWLLCRGFRPNLPAHKKPRQGRG